MALTEAVVETTRKTLKVVMLDEDDNPLTITGGAVRLRGASPDLPGVTLDVAGTIVDGPNGLCGWAQVGSLVTSANLAGKPSAAFNLRVFLTLGGLTDYGPLFQFTWFAPPI